MKSNKSEYLLTFEWDAKNETLEIHGNRIGLENLKKMIDSILTTNNDDHIHLMTKSWGGNELSNEKQCLKNTLIHHVKLFRWIET